MKKIASFLLSTLLVLSLSTAALAATPKHTFDTPACTTHQMSRYAWSRIRWEDVSCYARARFESGSSIIADTDRIIGYGSAYANTQKKSDKHCVSNESYYIGTAYYGENKYGRSAADEIVYGVNADTGEAFITTESAMNTGFMY